MPLHPGAGRERALVVPRGSPFNTGAVLECSCGMAFIHSTTPSSIISVFNENEKGRNFGAHTHTHTLSLSRSAHLLTAPLHPTYSIAKAGVAAFQFPVECSVDLSRPAFGRVAQEPNIIIIFITSHVCSTCAYHHRKQQQRQHRSEQQQLRTRARRRLLVDSSYHCRLPTLLLRVKYGKKNCTRTVQAKTSRALLWRIFALL